MDSLLEELKIIESTKATQARDSYLRLVADVAAGRKIKAAVAQPILEAAKVSADAFAKECQRIKERPVLQGKLKEHAALNKELNTIPGKYDAVEVAFSEFKKKHYDEPRDRLSQRSTELNRLLEEISDARDKLMAECTNPEILARESEVIRQRSEALEQQRKIESAGVGTAAHCAFHPDELAPVVKKVGELTAKLDAIREERIYASF